MSSVVVTSEKGGEKGSSCACFAGDEGSSELLEDNDEQSLVRFASKTRWPKRIARIYSRPAGRNSSQDQPREVGHEDRMRDPRRIDSLASRPITAVDLTSTPPRQPCVFMLSPHREVVLAEDIYGELVASKPSFSKQESVNMSRRNRHVGRDLYTPVRSELDNQPLTVDDLAPLCLFSHLRSLKVLGMMQSYQSYIWEVVWLNPQLNELTMGMEVEDERLDCNVVEKARQYAQSRPTVARYQEKKATNNVPEKLPIVKLSLYRFQLDNTSFRWFDETRFRELRLFNCMGVEIDLPEEIARNINVSIERSGYPQ